MNWRAYQLLQSVIILQLGNRHIIVLIVSLDTVNIKTKLASNILLSWSRCWSGSIIDRQIKCTQLGDKIPQIDCWIQFSCSIQWISHVFFPCFNLFLGPVHTYPDIFESATFSFRIRLSSTRIRRIRKQIRKFLNPLSRVEIFESDNISDTCGRSNPDMFWYDDVTTLAQLFTSQI